MGLTYITISHFTHCLYFFLTPKGLGKILRNSQNICSSYVKPSNKMNESNQMKMIPQYWSMSLGGSKGTCYMLKYQLNLTGALLSN